MKLDTDPSLSRQPPLPLSLIAAIISLAGLCLFLWNIENPVTLHFDETHYVAAAKSLIDFSQPENIEHPLVGKLLIGFGINLFGDRAFGWRVMSALAGSAALFSAVMLAGHLFKSTAAAAMTGVFMLTDHLLFIQSRIAMLEVFMLSFLLLGLWMIVASIRSERGNRIRIVIAAVAFALSIGSKWTAVPVVAMVGIGFVLAHVKVLSTARDVENERLIPGVPLLFGLICLAPLSALIYLATFSPMFFLTENPLSPQHVLAHQFEMLDIQTDPMAPHPYSSVWWQWVLNLRPVWYLYEPVLGVQRGVLFVGNPFTMMAGLVAILGCIIAWVRERNIALLSVALVYVLTLGTWVVIPKAVTFYYHYLIPSTALAFALGGTLHHFFLARRRRLVPLATIAASLVVFVYFYPILSAAPLPSPGAFNKWMWLDSWR